MSYKGGAKHRGLEFTLTEDEFVAKVRLPCAYCGDEPSRTVFSHPKAARGSVFVCSGLDRIDNRLGYTSANTVPCCGMCNHMKGTESQEVFVSKCRAIASFRSDL
jgi:hypothetical protein